MGVLQAPQDVAAWGEGPQDPQGQIPWTGEPPNIKGHGKGIPQNRLPQGGCVLSTLPSRRGGGFPNPPEPAVGQGEALRMFNTTPTFTFSPPQVSEDSDCDSAELDHSGSGEGPPRPTAPPGL